MNKELLEANKFLRSRDKDTHLKSYINELKFTNTSTEWKEKQLSDFLKKNYSLFIPNQFIESTAHYALL